MNATQELHTLGQSLWLDNITRRILDDGTLQRYITDLSVTGLTSNPTIFHHAIAQTNLYEDAIREQAEEGKSGESLFFELALDDLTRAADLFRPAHDATDGRDGWVSLEVSPSLTADASGTLKQARVLHLQAGRPNVFIKIPGTPAGMSAIEAAVFAGVPVNVTLLFSREHYLAAADAYLRAIERRIGAGLDPKVDSVASIFISRWDRAVAGKVPEALSNELGIAIAKRTYLAYRQFLASPRWQRAAAAGARPQRLLWASTGTKDPEASDVLYVEALAAPDTINTMPEATLVAFAEHGKVRAQLPSDGGDAEAVLGQFAVAGVDVMALAGTLQREGAEAFVASWRDLIRQIGTKAVALRPTGSRRPIGP